MQTSIKSRQKKKKSYFRFEWNWMSQTFPVFRFFLDWFKSWMGGSILYWLGVNGEVYDWYFSRGSSPPAPAPPALQRASPQDPLRKTPLMLIIWLLEPKKHSSSCDTKCKYSYSHSILSHLGKDLNIVCTSWNMVCKFIIQSICWVSIVCWALCQALKIHRWEDRHDPSLMSFTSQIKCVYL